MSMDICKVVNCGRRLFASGFCRTHHRWWKSGKDMTQEPRVGKYDGVLCTVEGCDSPAKFRQMCGPHYRCFMRNGHTDIRGRGNSAITATGYRLLYSWHPDNHLGFKEYEHRVVMAKILGRPLIKGENVHHINGEKLDNRPENLELWSTSQPPGQRARDKLAWAYEIIELYRSINN